MIYRTHIPRPPLSDFVEKFWFYEGYAPRGTVEGVLPDASMNLIFNLRGDEGPRLLDPANPQSAEILPGCVVTGTHSGFAVVDTAGLPASMGVHFKPGGAFPFLGVSAAELRDAHAPLEAVWGSSARELHGRLIEARTPEDAFLILERTLVGRARRPLERHPAVSLALQDLRSVSPARTVSDLIRRTGLSRKRFVRAFRDEVGLTPKLYSRIRRFQALVGALEGGRRSDWGELALVCGYFDQAHFIHDFRAFSGVSPGVYVTNRGSHANHVALEGRAPIPPSDAARSKAPFVTR